MLRFRFVYLILCLAVAGLATNAGASLAKQLGSAYGGKLSKNKSTQTQQLTSDPASVAAGSNTLSYNANRVSFQSFFPAEPFSVTLQILVQYSSGPGPEYVDYGTYREQILLGGLGEELGTIKSSFTRTSSFESESIIPTEPGYEFIGASDNFVQGDDTHALFFTLRNPADFEAPVSYTIFADAGDFLDEIGNPNRITQIAPATVSGNFVPEPASGMLMFIAGGWLLGRRRRGTA